MMIAKYPPTKYWRRLSLVRHGDAQRLQKLKAPWQTKRTEKEGEKERTCNCIGSLRHTML